LRVERVEFCKSCFCPVENFCVLRSSLEKRVLELENQLSEVAVGV